MEVKDKIVIHPSKEILFTSNTVGDINTSKLTLSNIDKTKCIAYKIKTTAPKNYSVKPNMGIIDCSSNVVVDITFCPSDNNNIAMNKFLI